MKILALTIKGFRGIQDAHFVLPQHVALVGANGIGKSTIIDALSLVFGRNKLVRELTEHDFYGSHPGPTSRIRIVATLGGFRTNDPGDFPHWFRQDRGIPKSWDPQKMEPVAVSTVEVPDLCVQIGYAARFDLDELFVEQIRYFHDDDDSADPFLEEVVAPFPIRLLNEIGFFVLPARRTWPSTISFGSELFRRAVTTLGGLPANTVREHLESLRKPEKPLEADEDLKPLVERINARLAQLIPGRPKLQLRLTSTDSESLLQALVPHYEREDGVSLPAGRHGTGLLSLQSLVLLLEIGRARIEQGQSFILAVEEPELHVPPGLQRRIIGEAAALAHQTICTTHAPRVAAFFDAQSILLLTKTEEHEVESAVDEQIETRLVVRLVAKPLASSSMMAATNAVIQLYTDHRALLVEALMFPRVLIPEGRTDFEWLRLLRDVMETGERPLHPQSSEIPPFSAIVGVVPTRDSAVKVTFEHLRTLREGIAAVVDGDDAGDRYVADLASLEPAPCAVVQWPAGWTIEDVVGWLLDVGDEGLVSAIWQRLELPFEDLQDLVAALKRKEGEGCLKQHYIAHEEIAGAMKTSERCVARVEAVLEALTRATLGELGCFPHLEPDQARSRGGCPIYRFRP